MRQPPANALAAATSTTVPYLQSDGTNRLFPLAAGLATMSTDGAAVLLVTADGSVSFASLATGATLWSPLLVQAGQAPGQLELTADGELRLITMGKVLWKAGTAGRAKGPVRLTAKGQDLALQDLASNRTIWLAPVGCSVFGAAQLLPLAQCGGLSPVAQAQAAAVTQLADAPWANTCCPTAHQCSMSSSGKWLCQPSRVLDSCIGPRTLPVSELCGGTNLCGEDAACSTSCCSEGNYCQRLNGYTWSCAPLANFAGGAAVSAGLRQMHNTCVQISRREISVDRELRCGPRWSCGRATIEKDRTANRKGHLCWVSFLANSMLRILY
jgi:hypothetical protein